MEKKALILFVAILFTGLLHVSAQMRVHMINVGQGSATLVEFPCAAILIDAGGETNSLFNSSDALKNYLDDFFDRRNDLNHTLQCVYLTHPHKDHTLGVPVILQQPYIIKNAVTDGLEQGSGKPGQVKLHRAVQAAEVTAGTSDDIGFDAVTTSRIGTAGLTNEVIDPVNCVGTDPVIKILWGTSATNPGWSNGNYNKENNQSLAIRIDYGTSSLLLTGDLEVAALKALLAKYNGSNLLDADVLMVGHHGAANACTLDLLNKVTPQIAMISAGNISRKISWTAWDYGHPNKSVLDMLQNKLTATRNPIDVMAGTGAKKFVSYAISKAIYATGWDDNVVLEADNAGHWRKVDNSIVPALVNINTATGLDLQTLPGIGATKAQAIIDYRTNHGNFTSVDELDNVPGIGPSTINLIRPYVTI